MEPPPPPPPPGARAEGRLHPPEIPLAVGPGQVAASRRRSGGAMRWAALLGVLHGTCWRFANPLLHGLARLVCQARNLGVFGVC